MLTLNKKENQELKYDIRGALVLTKYFKRKKKVSII